MARKDVCTEAGQIAIPRDLTDAHPLVVATQAAAKGMRFDEVHGKQGLDVAKKHLDIRVSPEQFQLALRICSALIYATESMGAKWVVDDNSDTWVLYGAHRMRVCLIEKMKKVIWPHEPPPRLKAAAKTRPNWKAMHPRNKLAGTGLMEFKVLSYVGPGIKGRWGDEKHSLENEIAAIVAGIPLVAAAGRAHDEDLRVQAIARAEKRQTRVNDARRAEIKKILRERLIQAARSWQKAASIRAYRTAVAKHFQNMNLLAADQLKLDLWLDWANVQADSIDPLHQDLTALTDNEVSLSADFDNKVQHSPGSGPP